MKQNLAVIAQITLRGLFIVSQPQSGLVLAKSFYRIIGTVIGATVALLLVALWTAFAFCTSVGRFVGAGVNFALAGAVAAMGTLGTPIAITAVAYTRHADRDHRCRVHSARRSRSPLSRSALAY